MHRDNDLYGHGPTLRHYAKVDIRHRIPGLLQHGWTPGPGVSADRWTTRWPSFIWSRRNLAICEEFGLERAVPIGAPFLYLDPPAATAAPPARSLVAFPLHGWAGEPIEDLHHSFEAYARALECLERDGFSPITVCLYWLEHRDADVRAIFERRGYQVTTMGTRTESAFLERTRALLLAHEYMTSNQLSTAMFYGLSQRRKCFLWGPRMSLKQRFALHRSRAVSEIQKEFPCLSYESFGDRCFVDIGNDELGAEFRLPPPVLRELFSWNPGRRPSRVFVAEMKAAMLAHRILRRVDHWRGVVKN